MILKIPLVTEIEIALNTKNIFLKYRLTFTILNNLLKPNVEIVILHYYCANNSEFFFGLDTRHVLLKIYLQ